MRTFYAISSLKPLRHRQRRVDLVTLTFDLLP